MTHRVAVIDVVALSEALWSPELSFLNEWCSRGLRIPIVDGPPGLTCTSQTTYLTGVQPSHHGIVGNGWYFRDLSEVRFWHQSSRLIQAPRLWDQIGPKQSGITVANLFWWYNMYSAADYSLTPRPIYRADGSKIPAIYGTPDSLAGEVIDRLGPFPLRHFWGPGASIISSRWIAESAKIVEERHRPSLSLVYLPHLDYNLQRVGPHSPVIRKDLREIDRLLRDLVAFLEARDVRVIVLSEYAIHEVTRPVHLNRVLREHGLLRIRDELGHETLDAGGSAAFAVADHQLAHVYVNDPPIRTRVEKIIAGVPGVSRTYSGRRRAEISLDHPRAGDIVAIAEADAWFSYQYWLDDSAAPDFARTVDIHRKPGYDPLELFVDPKISFPAARLLRWKLARMLGFRSQLELIPLDCGLVRGSHGYVGKSAADRPLLLASDRSVWSRNEIDACEISDLIRQALGAPQSIPAVFGA